MDVIAPRYVTRLECAGAACEDTCCSGWNVTVDRDAFRRLRSVLGEGFGEDFTRIRDRPRTKEKFGLVVLQPDTLACTFLNEKRLCSLHARFGEEVLPDGCASFLRRQSSVGTRVETSLSLACPEAAREALIPRDAMELVDLDPADLSRQHRVRVAIARFLVLAHPSLTEATVERVAVEVISRMSREVDHHPLFAEWLEQHLAEELPTIERVLGLAHL